MKNKFKIQDSDFSRTAWFLAVLVLGLGAGAASAQQYAVPWFKIAGGGGMQSTSGVGQIGILFNTFQG